MLVSLGNKHFRLRKFPPIVGRELMMKGKGVRALVKNTADWLTVLAYVDVRLSEDRWLPLSTKAMILNHVQPHQVEELFMLQLTDNCFCIKDLLSSPGVGDTLRELIYEVIDEVIENAS